MGRLIFGMADRRADDEQQYGGRCHQRAHNANIYPQSHISITNINSFTVSRTYCYQ